MAGPWRQGTATRPGCAFRPSWTDSRTTRTSNSSLCLTRPRSPPTLAMGGLGAISGRVTLDAMEGSFRKPIVESDAPRSAREARSRELPFGHLRTAADRNDDESGPR